MKYRSFYFPTNHSSRSFWSYITFLLNFYMSFGISGLLLVSPVAFTVLTSTAYNWHCSGKYCGPGLNVLLIVYPTLIYC